MDFIANISLNRNDVETNLYLQAYSSAAKFIIDHSKKHETLQKDATLQKQDGGRDPSSTYHPIVLLVLAGSNNTKTAKQRRKDLARTVSVLLPESTANLQLSKGGSSQTSHTAQEVGSKLTATFGRVQTLFLNTFTNNADLHSNLLHWTEEKKTVLFLSEKQT